MLDNSLDSVIQQAIAEAARRLDYESFQVRSTRKMDNRLRFLWNLVYTE